MAFPDSVVVVDVKEHRSIFQQSLAASLDMEELAYFIQLLWKFA